MQHRVYIKCDERDRVVDINSDIFLRDLTGWIKIDEGEGDRYAHAQIHYLDEPLHDNSVPLYKWNGAEMVPRDQEEIDADLAALPQPELKPDPLAELTAQVEALKRENAALVSEGTIAMLAIVELYEMMLGGV